MENLTLRLCKIKAKAEKLKCELPPGRTGGIHYLPGNTVPVRWHPARSRDFDAYTRDKVVAISAPGRASEAEMIRALRFETQSKDAALFREALSGESWRGRSR